MATIDVIKETLSDNLDIEADAVTADATLDSLGIDSLDARMMQLTTISGMKIPSTLFYSFKIFLFFC